MFAQIVYKSFATNPDYFVLCEKGVLRVVQEETESNFEIGEFIRLDGVEKEAVVYASSIDLASSEEEEKLVARANRWKRRLLLLRDPQPILFNSRALSAMLPRFKEAAVFVESAVLQMQPIFVRFDEDTDGITSALYFHSMVEHFVREKHLPYPKSFFKAFQSEAPIFEHKHFQHVQDLSRDFARMPLLVLLDHGGNEESLPALQAAKKEGFALMLVDHHPAHAPSLQQFDFVLHLKHGSDYCTGLLSYHVAASVYDAPKEWAYYAMQGDKSAFALKEHFKEPVVLDYLSNQKLSLRKYASVLNDRAQVDALYAKCLRLREKALEKALEKRRLEYVGGVTVQWLDLSYAKENYPPKGGVVQGLHEAFEEKGPLVTAGYDDERVIFRANAGAAARGFKANELIAELKKIPDVIASGGGHPRAASLRLKPKKLPAVLEALEKRFQRMFV